MSNQEKNTSRIFEGPFSEVAFEFTSDDEGKRDNLRIIFRDGENKVTETVCMSTRVSPLDNYVEIMTRDSKGNSF